MRYDENGWMVTWPLMVVMFIAILAISAWIWGS